MDLAKKWKRNCTNKAAIRRTYKELSQLTDQELRDLGIGLSDITSIALGNFHDKRMSNATTNKNLRGWV